MKKKAEIFAGKLTRPDSEDPDTVNHLNWYMSTGFTRPYPGETRFDRRASSTTRHRRATGTTTKTRFD